MASILQTVNVTNSVAVGGAAGAIYYALVDDNLENAVKVTVGVGLASAISDYLSTLVTVQSYLADFLKSFLRPVLVGGVTVAMGLFSGMDMSDLESIAYTFGLGFGAKLAGDYLSIMYDTRMRGGSGSGASNTYV